MPRVKEHIDRLNGAKFVTILDLAGVGKGRRGGGGGEEKKPPLCKFYSCQPSHYERDKR